MAKRNDLEPRRAGVALAAAFALALAASTAAADSKLPPGQDFGAGITLSKSQALAEVAQHPERFTDGPILLHGRISDVCQKKGCWTVLTQGDHHLRIRFKDYGFFLPKDSSGKQAWVEGLVQVELEDEGDAKHYASESTSPNPVRRLRGFTASGVRLAD